MRILLLFVLVFCYAWANSQSPSNLYLPTEFQQAYKKGTRSPDGKVAARYWQNRSEYKIKASIDPLKKLLSGDATIVYHNNSPDTLESITFHTYHDYYKANSLRAGFFNHGGETIITDGVMLNSVSIENEQINLKDEERVRYQGTNYSITLNKPLPPKSKLNLQISWKYEIPGDGFERSGAIDSTSMFIAYWYPEIAVYDDVVGWDRVVYDAATEFYHDYSDFDVEVEAPDNYMLWASVPPLNESEVYSKTIIEKLAKAKKSIEPVVIWSEADFAKGSKATKRWKYKATDFPDFAFALSNDFIWNAATYKDKFGEYFIQSAYPPAHQPFSTVVKTIAESLKSFHNDFPVYPFPYKYFTIFNGLNGGGMEFPGMANNTMYSGAMFEQWTGKKVDDFTANLGLTQHEMCHMYFPFMMGINEKRYAWMDEGMADFAGFFLPEIFPQAEVDQPYLGSQSILPMITPSHMYDESGINSYTIAAYSYNSLYHLLGKDVFFQCLKEYMDTWKHKHPTPFDFMFTFNRVSKTDLNWFWKKWYFDWGYMDVGVRDVKGRAVTLENLGGRPLAFSMEVTFSDNTTQSLKVNPGVWKDSSTHSLNVEGTKTIKEVFLKIPTYGDAMASNNRWRP